ncbi:hypothetical protein ACOMICROBIO_FLGHMIGD_01581 [Vibrio sp. B1FLJ16]|uniref:hypothetical protein n=1 Tax=Vibrio sp. B1FLJ16 TaxID=2751178 RepID=UPI0015F62265|nr:hypothetical protein [Vibrio sp. B1FLJ16]CAD7806825.1 hypothetical protein ACOMICROBIO_FLGHMIGD_01581 [Vibrio sp. B1FLJ16]CAE6903129.1 hypothetical protein ACOMICROBIO_FLGHMIGD_01581 [Vibrio sp. B1FLJ16]
MANLLKKIQNTLSEVLDFQSRIWVVNVYGGPQKGESFIVNEDSFSAPLQWMKRKGYNTAMLQQVETMERSQILEFDLDDVQHRLMRVK